MTPQMQNLMLNRLKNRKNIHHKRKMNKYLVNIQTMKTYIIQGLVVHRQDILTLLCIDKL